MLVQHIDNHETDILHAGAGVLHLKLHDELSVALPSKSHPHDENGFREPSRTILKPGEVQSSPCSATM